MNRQSDRQLKKFAAIFFILLLATAASFGATAALTLQVNGEGTISSFTNGQQLLIGKSYSIEAHDKADFTFTGWTGSQTSSKSKLTFVMAPGLTFTANFSDKKNPTLTIATPPGSKKLTSDTIIVTGTARDNAAVTNVSYSLNGEDWQPAMTGNGWSNWWATVTLNANTNTLRAYAVDSSGNISKTEKMNMTLIAVPLSLDGLTAAVTVDDTNEGFDSFDAKTFTEGMRVGTYVFKKVNAATGKISLTYTAPPSAAKDSATVYLQFTNNDSGSFTNNLGGDGSFGLFQTNLVPLQLAGTTIIITNDSAESTNLTFPAGPQIIDNGHMFNVANPLLISLSTPYAGEIGDRVSVPFIQLKNISGQFVQVGTPSFVGTVIGIGTNADTVTILFDKPSFVSKTELFAPVADDPVNILTYYFTNFLGDATVTNGAGTYTFTPYSPIGGLLLLDQKTYSILTFTASDSGNYYEESGTNSDSGSFGLTLPPQITVQPADVTTTNGGSATFSVTAIGSQPLAYQWQMNGADLTDGTNDWGSIISGSTSNVLTLTTVATNDAGTYQVIVTNNFGNATSQGAQLTIGDTNSAPPGD
jgi:uncharacterized repeat protein (TIGR02543 family)